MLKPKMLLYVNTCLVYEYFFQGFIKCPVKINEIHN